MDTRWVYMKVSPFLFLLFLLRSVSSEPPFGGYLIDCGSSVPSTIDGLEWLPDSRYISNGIPRNVADQVENPTLSTVRSFPLQNNLFKKFCYEIPVIRTRKYLIRTSYYYGGVNGNDNPPVFDQIVDGTIWSLVNTTDDYLNGDASYYEGVFLPTGKNLSVCLASNTHTDSDPFISSLEIVPLRNQLYNSTDFKAFSLSLVARHRFGYSGRAIGYPDDLFNRYWGPFGDNLDPPQSSRNLAVSGIWNLPPMQVFQSQLSMSTPEPLSILWPPGRLSSTEYYIALYFAEDQSFTSGRSRILDIVINGVPYYNNLSVPESGVVVFANKWPLSGVTNLTLNPSPESIVGPLINAGEAFQIIPSGGKTLAHDVIGMIDLRRSFKNPPSDWYGDPCLPRGYSWTGVSCSYGPRIRVVTLNLTGMGLSGSISPNIVRITGLTNILLGRNGLWGTIPDLGLLKGLAIVQLEDNQLTGAIPPSLGTLTRLRELFLQNNNLTGQVPSNLLSMSGLSLRFAPGNPFLTLPPES